MAKVVKSNRNSNGPKRGYGGLKIHQKKDLLLVVGASNKGSLFVLRPFLNSSGLLLHKQLKIARGPEIQRELFNGLVGLVADEEVELQIVAG